MSFRQSFHTERSRSGSDEESQNRFLAFTRNDILLAFEIKKTLFQGPLRKQGLSGVLSHFSFVRFGNKF